MITLIVLFDFTSAFPIIRCSHVERRLIAPDLSCLVAMLCPPCELMLGYEILLLLTIGSTV